MLKVVDGATVDIVDDVRGRLRIRLLGIDTPEPKKPGYTVGCWGPAASEFAKSNLLGQRVAFFTDPSQGAHGDFLTGLIDVAVEDGIVTDDELDQLCRAAAPNERVSS